MSSYRFVPGRKPPQHQHNNQGDHVNAKGRVKFYNDAKGWIVEAAVKWTVDAVLAHFQ
jgi:hypothetical protein